MTASSLEKTRALCNQLSSESRKGLPLEGSLSSWLYYRRKKVRGGWDLPVQEQTILEEYNLGDLFRESAYDSRDKSLAKVYETWVLVKGGEPQNNPADELEYQLYRWMARKRAEGDPPEAPKIFPNLYSKPVSREEVKLINAQQIISWYLEHGSAPSSKAEGVEGKLGKCLSNMRTVYRKRGLVDPVAILLHSVGLIFC